MHRHSQAYIARITQQTIHLISDYDQKTDGMEKEERSRRHEQIKTCKKSAKHIFFFDDTEPQWFNHLTALEFNALLKETMVHVNKLPLRGED